MNDTVTFIHAADLHLGAPFTGLASLSDSLSAHLVDAVEDAYGRIIDLCIRRKVDFLVLAGDTFDEGQVPYRAQRKFIDGLGRLDVAGVEVYICMGNHDPLPTWGKRLSLLPGNTHVFPADAPGYYAYSREGVPLVGLGGMSYEVAADTRDLARLISREEATSKLGRTPYFVGVLHTGLANSVYAPCTTLELRDADASYWALGHIHKQSIADPDVPAVYPGTPQGLDINETSEHGCCMVTLSKGHPAHLEFPSTASVAFERLSIDVSNFETPEDLHDQLVARGRELVARRRMPVYTRVIATGRSALYGFLQGGADVDELCAAASHDASAGSDWLYIEGIANQSKPLLDYATLSMGGLFPSVVLDEAKQLSGAPDKVQGQLEARLKKLGLTRYAADVDMQAAMDGACDACLDSLLGGGA